MRRLAKIALIAAMIVGGVGAGWIPRWGSAARAEPSRSDVGWIAFAAYRDANWDIYAIRADGSELRRLTTDPAEESRPAWSPDASQLAFQSTRSGNWDVYVQGAAEESARQLTIDPSYDGAPAWSPDGSQIAFDSYRAGDLDVMIMDAEGTAHRNLTTSSSAGDFDPAWSPDGSRLAFTSWRMGDNDIFVLDLASDTVTQRTESYMPEGNASWSPDGRALAYTQDQGDRLEVYAEGLASGVDGSPASRLTWFCRDDSVAWAPDGEAISFISHQHTNDDAEYLLVQDLVPAGGDGAFFATPRLLLAGWEITGPLSWTGHDISGGEPVPGFVPEHGPFLPGIMATAARQSSAEVAPDWPFTDLVDVVAPNARLHTKYVEAFEEIRRDVKAQTGYDFLSELSDMWRGVDARSEGSAYLSWHKAGQAFDMLFDYRDASNHALLEVVSEDAGGETFWRIYLKAALQDGSMGSPLKVHPWDLSGAARRKHPQDGGTWKAIPYGYYVDVSRIVRHAGWERISSVDRRDFSWRWHFLAIEYWHYQIREGLTWYQTIADLYSPERAHEYFDWSTLAREGEDPYTLFGNGLPIPPRYARWEDVKP